MAPSGFQSKVDMTFIGTATAIISVDGINFITDPVFDQVGTTYDMEVVTLESVLPPALGLHELPPIDVVLLSHEDHPDNLDTSGRTLLNGRPVITTPDGAKNLKPRPAVHAINPWQTLPLKIGGKAFSITGTPCVHVPGGETTGFILHAESFGTSLEGLPNAIYFSGDTIYIEELAQMRKKFHIVLAVINLGGATAPTPDGPVPITLDGKSAVKLVQDIGAEVVVPIHYDSWKHFNEPSTESSKIFVEAGLKDKVIWLEPGVVKNIL
ncbi:N-acyl-phosphatidylethanolamine-hydrolyzing phospholipase D, mitochondrial Short=NAPE-PLD [Rhizoctonia solani AG-1 IB]|uniref:N-acyl-phosphatidylethanolamine-hydrolyzing phospholipase D, mitochondrial Short=NAPE-PLD n=1 Tax=Thanatephorus cucumeris (strain AG1-IB / isolate 7/3/14) TaxID=1108050 RepID=M5C760_THACB|nr:N-acyl-phosphatidylethanolamine-hydrolyzing phospholipase D, mitochondrial Short=NAPE-PLD [Rhizoctonia solani AG-1 IB]